MIAKPATDWSPDKHHNHTMEPVAVRKLIAKIAGETHQNKTRRSTDIATYAVLSRNVSIALVCALRALSSVMVRPIATQAGTQTAMSGIGRHRAIASQ